MKKTIKPIIMLLVLVVYSCSIQKKNVNTIVPTTISLLQSTEWEADDAPPNIPYQIFDKYENDKLVSTVVYNKKEERTEYMYYLSDKIESFDSTKVGKFSNGKYIIMKRDFYIFVLEIKKLDTNELILRNVSKETLSSSHYRPIIRKN